MSNLKDTDFGDLFRRASDKYPLRTDSSDWEKMAAALDDDPTPAWFDGTATDDGRRKRRFFWLLLLLPLGGAGYYAWNHTGHAGGQPAVAVVAGKGGAEVSRKVGAGDGKRGPDVSGNGMTGDRKNGPDVSGNGVTGDRKKGSDVSGNGVTGDRKKGSDESDVSGGAVGSRSKEVATGSANAVGGRRQGNEGSVNDGIGGVGGDRPERANSGRKLTSRSVEEKYAAGRQKFADGSGGRPKVNDGSGPGGGQAYVSAPALSLEWGGDVQRAHIAADYRLTVDVTAPPAANNPDPAKPKKPKSSYLYAGILGAPDISTVKMQSVKGVGATFGVLAGYAFNERWAIETGAYIESKKYYTEGEYFKKTLPYGSTLLNVNGTCYMWEIPLNVRYTFNPDSKTRFFATAGLSTYLMSKENYTYSYETVGGRYGQNNWKINQPSQYPFSIVNLSGGFEQRLGKVGNLRIEPYLRLPLAGIGTGKLPIMSAGVNIGITRRLW